MHKSYQIAVETPALRTSHDDLLTKLYLYAHKSYQLAVETPTLRTSQDITTHTHIYIYIGPPSTQNMELKFWLPRASQELNLKNDT